MPPIIRIVHKIVNALHRNKSVKSGHHQRVSVSFLINETITYTALMHIAINSVPEVLTTKLPSGFAIAQFSSAMQEDLLFQQSLGL
jgi:hypothetical protein